MGQVFKGVGTWDLGIVPSFGEEIIEFEFPIEYHKTGKMFSTYTPKKAPFPLLDL